MNICNLNSSFKIKVHNIKTICRHHRKRDYKKFLLCYPERFCAVAYNYLYIFALSALYSKEDKIYRIKCPAKKVVFLIKSERIFPFFISIFLKFITSLIQDIFHRPFEIIQKRVWIYVQDLNSKCAARLKKNQKFEWNTRNILCPASFYNIAPVIFSSKKKSSSFVSCPSPDGTVYNLNLKISKKCYKSYLHIIKMITPSNLFKKFFVKRLCPVAFYSSLPYLFVFSEKGNFGWISNKDPVSVTCFRPNGIYMQVFQNKIVIKKSSRECIHKPGSVFFLNPKNTDNNLSNRLES